MKRLYVTLVLTTQEREWITRALVDTAEDGCSDCYRQLIGKVKTARVYTKTTAGGYPFRAREQR